MEFNMKELTGKIKALAIIFYLLMVIAGAYLIFVPRSIVWMFIVAVTVHGLLLIIKYFSSAVAKNGWDIISGVIYVLFGAVMLFGNAQTKIAGIMSIEMFIAFWTLFAGFSHIFNSFALKKSGIKNWLWTLVGGILMVLFGCIYIAYPLMGTVMLVGIGGIYAGVTFLMLGITGLAAALSGGGGN